MSAFSSSVITEDKMFFFCSMAILASCLSLRLMDANANKPPHTTVMAAE
jgi:hypothetical protein